MILSGELYKKADEKFLVAQFNLNKQADFLESVLLLVKDGISARDALRLVAESNNPVHRQVAYIMLAKLREGFPFSSGMEQLFRKEIIISIVGAELTEHFADSGLKVVAHIREQSTTYRGVFAKLLQPVVYLGFAVGLYVMFSITIWPRIAELAAPDTWHTLARINYSAGLFFIHYWPYMIFLTGLVLCGVWALLRQWAGPRRKLLDRAWPFTLYRSITASRVMDFFNTMMLAGHDFRTVLATALTHFPPYANLYISQMHMQLREGRNIARALDVGLFTKHDVSRLRLLSELQGLEHTMARMGAEMRRETLSRLRVTSIILSGVGRATVALSYAGLVASLYLNVESLYTQLRAQMTGIL
ncbi:MAG: hypothetical protein F4Y53_06605 [Proteobacteria bacterium]|nr:hypothetical protein [Pseudomonadota bacterium]